MKKTDLFLITTLLMCCMYACDKGDAPSREEVEPAKPIELTTKQGEKVSADNHFAFTMFKEVSVEPNTFFSPLSLNIALGMLHNGASGDTRTEMEQVLGMEDLSDIEINEYYQKMIQSLSDIDPLTEINIANSIWYRSGFSIKQPFININQQYFNAEVNALDFNKPDAAQIINQWCAQKTKDRIKEIVQAPISDEVIMYLINALYFKSKWQSEFDKKRTKQDDFTQTDHQKSKVNMMEQTTTLPYYANDYLQCVEMPYGNEAFSMVAILPSEDMSIDQLIDYLDNTTWQEVVSNMSESKIWLKFPRFKVECEMQLNDPVANVGMRLIFDKNFADFKNISDAQLFVSNITQKTFVEVNEEGTEAAAVTVIRMEATSIGPGSNPTPFFANRPFLYLIKERSTGVILFIGRMDKPVE